jgi:5-methylcytosine-specific restriction protein B
MITRIPRELNKQHILAAMDHIGGDQSTWPPRSASTKYDVVDPRNGARFPPKLVLEMAVKEITGQPLSRKRISGGSDTNRRLEALGFKILQKYSK